MKNKLTLIAIFSIFIVSTASATEVDIGYGSRYISESRNQLSSGGIYWISGLQEINENLALGIAYGFSASSDDRYDELNLVVQYNNSLAWMDYTLGYTRLEFFEDNESDDEISVGLTHTEIATFTPFANFVYSVEAGGFFAEFGGEKDFQLNEQVSITPHLLVAYDFGYASGEQDGYNHTSIGATLNYAVSEGFSICGIVEKTIGGSIVKREADKADQFWSGIHATYSW